MSQPLSEDERDTLITLVRGGAPLDQAVGHIGRSPAEFARWLRQRGQKELRSQLERALAQADLADLGVINQEGGWQAAKARFEIRRISERERQLHRLRELTTD